MKKIALFLILIMNFNLNASECHLGQVYEQSGWTVHHSSEFYSYFSTYHRIIEDGVSAGIFVKDQTGHMMTNATLDNTDLLMKVQTWDDLTTHRSIMFGDFAIFTSQVLNDPLEIRWFDGQKRHVVFNPSILNCISVIPPYAMNSII